MTATAPSSDTRKRGPLIGLVGLLAVLALVVVALVQAPSASKDGAKALTTTFFVDIKSGRYDDAAALTCPGVVTASTLQTGRENEARLGGELVSGTVAQEKQTRTFRFDWPPTEARVQLTYLLMYKKGAQQHTLEVRDTSAGLRICGLDGHA
ncbi:MAG: hypothetical protein JWO22_905 [Frankiales bacterium]|nr:hypothetical protein [Frankiales bacterium]